MKLLILEIFGLFEHCKKLQVVALHYELFETPVTRYKGGKNKMGDTSQTYTALLLMFIELELILYARGEVRQFAY